MAATTVLFPDLNAEHTDDPIPRWLARPPVLNQGDSFVRVRAKWSDDWSFSRDLQVTETTWSVSPTLPVATLVARYGEVFQWGNESLQEPFEYITRDSINDLVGQYVYIQAATSDGFWRDWYGRICEIHDEQGGIGPVTQREHGKCTLVAYGMEKLLADHPILDSRCFDIDGFETIAGVPIDFNRMGPRGVLGNRSADRLGTSYVFAAKASEAVPWSSRDILEYLITYQTPQDHTGSNSVPFRLELPPGVPTDADAPVIKAQNATTYSIISQLIDRRRCLQWWIEVDDDTNECVVKADSMVADPITGSKISIPANSNQINLRYETDPLTNAVINNTELQRVDQLVVQGPRIRCVGTLHYDHDSIEAGWTSSDETTYEAGGTPHPANTPLKRKQTRNDAARRSPTLENVYSLFQVPEDWDQQVGASGSEYPLFVDDAEELKKQNIPELIVEQTMPLLEGEDYSGSRIGAGLVATRLGTNEELRPFVLFLKPWTSSPFRFQNAEGSIASVEITHSKENPRLSCHVTVPRNTRSVRIKVNGQPQHAIAHSDFSPISGEDKKVGEFDWQQAFFTVSILSQDRTEGRYPETIAENDAIRRKVIYAGDQFYRDYVAPNTVVGLDEDGEIIVSAGGHIPAKGDAADPVPMLEDIARIAGTWYTSDHYVLTLESYRLKGADELPLGALVLKAGGDPEVDYQNQDINGPITQITFTYPEGMKTAKPARMQVKTWAGELDAVQFVAVKLPKVEKK